MPDATPRSRRSSAPPNAAPPAPAAAPDSAGYSAGPPPIHTLDDNELENVSEAIRDLLSSKGWAWLRAQASAEFGQKATLLRIANLIQQPGAPMADIGSTTYATMTASLAITRVLSMPEAHLQTLQVEYQRRRQASRAANPLAGRGSRP